MPPSTKPKTASRKRADRRSKTRPKARKSAQKRVAAAAPPAETAQRAARRTVWLLQDHLDRLEALKRDQRPRLRKAGLRASVTTLIDEAITAYLKQHEKKPKRR